MIYELGFEFSRDLESFQEKTHTAVEKVENQAYMLIQAIRER